VFYYEYKLVRCNRAAIWQRDFLRRELPGKDFFAPEAERKEADSAASDP
jgi:hypothetical protein